MFGWLRRLVQSPQATIVRRVTVRAKYDAAQSGSDTKRHWANADSLSAATANSPAVRKRLRERARYESANNSYCRGMTLTLANDLIGTGPRLQCMLDRVPQQEGEPEDSMDRATNRQIERAFGQWARAVNLADKLRTMKQAKVVDGEAFALFTQNDALPTSVKLDVKLIEADQVTTPALAGINLPNLADGIEFDEAGNPVLYHVLNYHPGDLFWLNNSSYKKIPARHVIHWFRCDRPGQVRGIPEITPALNLFAQLRRFTLAVLAAAETAAQFAAVLQSDAPPDGADPADPFETLELEQRMMTTLPAGWKLGQIQSEQPATTYGEFTDRILREISRVLLMPSNVSTGDSSDHNYASGRLDHQVYRSALRVERSQCELSVIGRVFQTWLEEAVNIPGLLPDGISVSDLPYQWFWDGWPHVDPMKEATANRTRLASRQTTLSEICAEEGKDWEDVLRQRAEEIKLVKALGLPPTIEEDPGQAWSQDTTPGGDVFEKPTEPTNGKKPAKKPGTNGKAAAV